MSARGWLLGAVAAAALAGLVLVVVDDTFEEFERLLPANGRRYARHIWEAARRHGVPPRLYAQVIAHESGFGAYLDTRDHTGKGDKGHGHGLPQIDDRTWGAWLKANNWKDPAVQLDKGAAILGAELRRFKGNVRAALSAYNAGPSRVSNALAVGRDPGTVTTHSKDGVSYPDNVLRRLV